MPKTNNNNHTADKSLEQWLWDALAIFVGRGAVEREWVQVSAVDRWMWPFTDGNGVNAKDIRSKGTVGRLIRCLTFTVCAVE